MRGAPVLQLHYTVPPLYAYRASGPRGIPNAHNGKFAMNSLGFRGPELEAGRETIVCLGASETFGIAESEGHEFPRQLEAQLNARDGERYQVVNAALPGQRLEDVATTLPHVLRKTRPAYAILYPSFASVAWTRKAWDATHPTAASKDPPPEQLGRIRIRERLENAVKNALPPAIEARLEHHPGSGQALTSAEPPVARLPQQNIDGFHHELDGVVGALIAHGVRPILATHATRFGPNGRYRDEQLRTALEYYPMVTADGLFDAERRMNDVIRATAHHFGIPVIDASNDIAPGPEDFADYFHFTDVGSGKMAALLANAIPG